MSSHPKVLVTGATGFVGLHLCRYLLEHHFYVVACGRQSTFPLTHPKLEYVCVPSINGTTDWTPLMAGVDYVVHLAARVHQMKDKGMQALKAYQETNVRGTQQLANAAIKHDVKRFVYISSIKVIGEKTIEMPLRAEDRPCPSDAYSVSKLKGELIVQEKARRSGMEWVIIRPPLVYGPGVKGNFARLIKLASRSLPLPFANFRNRRSFVSVFNLASFIHCCMIHPNANREVFLVSDHDDLSTAQLVKYTRRLQGKWNLQFPIPKHFLKGLAWLFGARAQIDRLADALQVNIEKSMRLLNWTPPLSVEESLFRTLKANKPDDALTQTKYSNNIVLPSSKQRVPSL